MVSDDTTKLKRKSEVPDEYSSSDDVDPPRESLSDNNEVDNFESLSNVISGDVSSDDVSSDDVSSEEEEEEELIDSDSDDDSSVENIDESSSDEDSNENLGFFSGVDNSDENDSNNGFDDDSDNSDVYEDYNFSDNNDRNKREEKYNGTESINADNMASDKVKITNKNKTIHPKSEIEKSSKSSIIKHNKETKKTKDDLSEYDEYAEGDTSDEEDIRNTIGNVPINWYDDYKHLGYDWDGKQILKPEHGDQLDYFLRRMEDPNFWKTVRDTQTGQDVVLSDTDVNLIQRLESQKIPDEAFDAYAPWIEWFTSEVMKMPLRKFPEHKRSFLPSLSEKRKVAKMVHALKMGWMKPTKKMERERVKKLKGGPKFYMLWEGDDVSEEMRRIHNHIPAPKRPLPGHAESYNPPSEYLFNEKEIKRFEKSKTSLGNKRLHFVPKKYSSLRLVPAYDKYLKERFNRCLDLYMCPRAIRMKFLIEPEDLLPKLPSPKDLQPFPTFHSLIFKGHTDMIRSISIDPIGQYLVSGSDDKTIKFWEISTGRCLKTMEFDGTINCVRWCPNPDYSIVAVACESKCYLVNPGLGDTLVVSKTNTIFEEAPPQDKLVHERVSTAVQWHWKKDNPDFPENVLIMIKHFKEITQLTWHGRGGYLATVMRDGTNRSVIINQLTKGTSTIPFSKPKGIIQCVLFHPVRPILFTATQKHIRVYDLVKAEMCKKLLTNCNLVSNMAIHPGGDNILVSSYDSKVVWLDLDLSNKPYKVLRLHNSGVRSVAYHKRYPLFASVSDDCSLIISHGMVYNDLTEHALIVPLKRFSDHKVENDYGIFEVLFHPYQPWVLTCGADKTIRLYS